MHTTLRTLGLTIAATLMLLGSGCAAYVNIPAVRGSAARSNPNTDNVRLIQAEALQFVIADSAIRGPVTVRLAGGASQETYDWVLDQFGGKGRQYGKADAAGPLYEVRGVRIRANVGEVDVAESAVAGAARMVTVSLDYDVAGGWDVVSMQAWGTIDDPSQEVFLPAGEKPAEW
ncbi:MAG: hypothetical protein AAF823_00760 [Planctomycetota bacterium]